MNLPVTALVLVLLLLAWLFVRRRQGSVTKSDVQPTATASEKNTAYHAVSIRFDNNACEAARDLEGRRFLSTAAPRLPLAECNVLECRCRFVHHGDRRTGKDRRSPFGPRGFGGNTGKFSQEQRQGKDRRHGEDEDFY